MTFPKREFPYELETYDMNERRYLNESILMDKIIQAIFDTLYKYILEPKNVLKCY